MDLKKLSKAAAETLSALPTPERSELPPEIWDTFEDFLTDPKGCGLVTASNLQRAITYVLDNEPVPDRLWEDPVVQEAFGGVRPNPNGQLLILAGIRCGKSAITAYACIRASQRISFDNPIGRSLLPGEKPRICIVSRTVETAQKTFDYIRGLCMGNPVINAMLVDEPKASSLEIRHPSGRIIVIQVVPASLAGTSLVGSWLAGLIFEEAPRMASEQDGKINIDDNAKYVQGRMLPGATIAYIGSPVGPVGFIYDMFQENWQKPEQRVVTVRARADWMNPVHWTPEVAEEFAKRDPDAHRTDFLCEFAELDSNLVTAVALERCLRYDPLELEPSPTAAYTAVMDPATSRNAWTLGIVETPDNLSFRVALCMEWVGTASAPLRPSDVFKEMRPVLERYGVITVTADQFAADAMRDLARNEGILLSPITITSTLKTKMYLSLKARVDNGLLEMPAVEHLRTDILSVRRTAKTNMISIRLPETNDGRHCDYAAMLALLCGQYLEETKAPKPPELTIDERMELDETEDADRRDREMYSDDSGEQGANW